MATGPLWAWSAASYAAGVFFGSVSSSHLVHAARSPLRLLISPSWSRRVAGCMAYLPPFP